MTDRNRDRLAECPVCKRGYRLHPTRSEPSTKPDTTVYYYTCTSCGIHFRKWFTDSHVDRATQAIEDADLPMRIRNVKDPYDLTMRRRERENRKDA